MPVCGNAFDLHTQFNQVVQVFFYLAVMLSVGKADQLRIAIFMVLVAEQAKPLEVGGVQPQVDMRSLYYFYAWRLLQKGIKSPLKRVNTKSAVAAKGFERLPFQYPFFEPDETIFQPLASIIAGKQHLAILAFESLFSGLLAPADNP